MAEKKDKSRSRSFGPEKAQKVVSSATSSKTSTYTRVKPLNVRIRSKSDGTSKHKDTPVKDRKLSKASKTSLEFVENENYDSIKTKILNQLTGKTGKPKVGVKKLKEKSSEGETRPKSIERKRPKSKYQKHEMEDLSNQGLALLNINTFQKSLLRILIISSNNLHSLPSAIRELINLEYLDVSKNPLKVRDANDVACFPLEMRFLFNLKRLIMSECNLRYIPAAVWLITSLENLDISRNKIGLLVPDVGNLQKLSIINLSQCMLTTLPPELGFCGDLTQIILWCNQIESLPETLKECTKLVELRMNYRNFHALLDAYMENLIRKGQIKSEHIPLVIFELVALKYLDLSSTKINNLPENELRSLNELHLDNNFFEQIPDTMFHVLNNNLKVFTISSNFIKQLPNEINMLESLEHFNISNNKLTVFPNLKTLALVNLRELYLSENLINELNGEIAMLVSLETLVLDHNKLCALPDGLFALVNLKYLDLSYNHIKKISHRISNLKRLESAHKYNGLNKTGLWLIGNPLELPSHEIWKTNSIDKIFRNLITSFNRDIDYIYFAKLIFLGESGAGKTCIADCLINPVNISRFWHTSFKRAAKQTAGVNSGTNTNNEDTESNNYVSTPLYTHRGDDSTAGLVNNRSPFDYTPVHGDKTTGISYLTDNVVADCMTRVARKLYLRTLDMCEFGIFDLAGDPSYHCLYPFFMSSIDFDREPCVFVIVYNHTDYDNDTHDKQIGLWLNYIQMYTKGIANVETCIRVKLVGVRFDSSFLDDLEATPQQEQDQGVVDMVLNNARRTISKQRASFEAERKRLRGMLETLDDADSRVAYLQQSIDHVDMQLNKTIRIIDKISFVDLETLKDDIQSLTVDLQDEVIDLNRRIPINMRNQLKRHVLKFDKLAYKTSKRTVLGNIDSKRDLLFDGANVAAHFAETTSNDYIIDYLVTIGELIWIKSVPNLRPYVYHHFGFLFDCLQSMVRHDWDVKFDFNKSTVFKQIGLYENEDVFNEDVKIAKKFGIFTYKLLDGLWFAYGHNKKENLNCLQLLQEFYVAYQSEPNVLERNQPIIKLVLPSMNTVRFHKLDDQKLTVSSNELCDKSMTSLNSIETVELGKEETYFFKLEKLSQYENIVKLIKGERKEQAIWDLNLLTYEIEDENEERKLTQGRRSALSAKYRKSINILNPLPTSKQLDEVKQQQTNDDNNWQDLSSISSTSGCMHLIANEYKHINSYKDVQIDMTNFMYTQFCTIEYTFQVNFDINLFYKLLVIIQQFVYERVDSIDCVLARDINNSIIKVQYEKLEPSLNKILIAIKSLNSNDLNSIKTNIDEAFDVLFSLYPGIVHLKSLSTAE